MYLSGTRGDVIGDGVVDKETWIATGVVVFFPVSTTVSSRRLLFRPLDTRLVDFLETVVTTSGAPSLSSDDNGAAKLSTVV